MLGKRCTYYTSELHPQPSQYMFWRQKYVAWIFKGMDEWSMIDEIWMMKPHVYNSSQSEQDFGVKVTGTGAEKA
jgi:hypothetical protein